MVWLLSGNMLHFRPRPGGDFSEFIPYRVPSIIVGVLGAWLAYFAYLGIKRTSNAKEK